jgi:hypothetical protein
LGQPRAGRGARLPRGCTVARGCGRGGSELDDKERVQPMQCVMMRGRTRRRRELSGPGFRRTRGSGRYTRDR